MVSWWWDGQGLSKFGNAVDGVRMYLGQPGLVDSPRNHGQGMPFSIAFFSFCPLLPTGLLGLSESYDPIGTC